MPDPMPRPTRLRFSDALRGARIVDRFMIVYLGVRSQVSGLRKPKMGQGFLKPET
jgi:hypothetical protein